MSKQYFPSNNNNNITKINNEPYSYKIGKIKMYVFDENELFNFLTWYWYNSKESFLTDFCNINYKIPWKYFCEKIHEFKTNYPNVDTYNSNIIEQANMVEIYDGLINVVGIDNFINCLIINKYKSMDFRKTNNIIYKFATDCGTQIFL
jgi:hypothetical protein